MKKVLKKAGMMTVAGGLTIGYLIGGYALGKVVGALVVSVLEQ